MKTSNLLITGRPGVGKTTVVVRTVRLLEGLRLAGFLTEEVREGGQRAGFAIATLAGERRVMARRGLASRWHVGSYGVDVAAIDEVLGLALAGEGAAEAFVIDEIGKMELCSERFATAVQRLLDDPRPLVASIALSGPGLIAAARRRPDAEVWEVDLANRNALPAAVAGWVTARLGR